eukprot:Seg3495.2 transcript_id=Seg3495.2/GoldUCD/mRNA.D3Y31 product="La-related protein 6" protein_id=Seg3495.2/GoldUCD/D3Y31
MEEKNSEVEVVIVAPQEEDEEALSDRPNDMGRSGSLSDSTPYITDSEGDDFYDAPEEKSDERSSKFKERISRKSSSIKLTPELKLKIVSQTEFLFSNENLEKDGFLLKHVKRNKEGYVNLKLLSSFKKMRSICKDYRVICEALKDSKSLVMNEEFTKVRRKLPLPEKLFDQPPVRFVVVSKMNFENPSMEILSEMFHDSGEISGVRIVRPGKKYPADLQSHFAHHPNLINETIAVVEFETADMAAEVMKRGLSDKYKESRLDLLHLGAKQLAKRTRQLSGGSENRSGNNDTHYSSFSSYRRRYNETGSRSSGNNSPQASPKISPKFLGKSESPSPGGSPLGSPSPQKKVSPDKNSQRKGNTGKFARDWRVSPLAKEASPATSPEIRRKQMQSRVVVETSSSLPNSPWITRRKLYNKDQNDNVDSLNGKLNAFGLIRQPRGPDGTKGFLQNANRIAIHA